jgi:peptidoglycan/LPS O-acetylase OafA/YrhL
MERQLYYLCYLRGAAALWVALHHATTGLVYFTLPSSDIVTRFFHRGWLGVDLFFILSGFILAYTYSKTPWTGEALKSFFIKRFARVYPVHFSVLTFLLLAVSLVSLAGKASALNDNFNESNFFAQLLLMHGIGFIEPGGWNLVSWSVSSEALAYVLFPLLSFLIRFKMTVLSLISFLIAMVTLSVTLAFYLNSSDKFILDFEYTWFRVLNEFFMGMLLFKLYFVLKKHWAFGFLAMIGIGGIILQGLVASSFYDFMYITYFMMIILGLALLPERRKNRALSYLGEISYSFYLIHSFVIVSLNQLSKKIEMLQSPVVVISLFLLISGLLAMMIYEQVEVKARKLLLESLLSSKKNQIRKAELTINVS